MPVESGIPSCMKVWFFQERWLDHKGHDRPAFYTVTELRANITDGKTLPDAIDMAYDLIACMNDWDDFCNQPSSRIQDSREAGEEMGLPEEAYIGKMDIDADLTPFGGWVRKGDPMPSKKQPMRWWELRKAFRLAYLDAKLKK